MRETTKIWAILLLLNLTPHGDAPSLSRGSAASAVQAGGMAIGAIAAQDPVFARLPSVRVAVFRFLRIGPVASQSGLERASSAESQNSGSSRDEVLTAIVQNWDMASTSRSHAFGSEPAGKPVGDPRSFRYTFPFVPPANSHVFHSVYGLDLADDGMPSVVLRSREVLDRKGAFKRLSVAFALLGIYEGVGLAERASGGIGGFHSSPA